MNQKHDAAENQTEDMDIIFDELCQAIMEGASYKDIYGVPQSTMDGLYAYAYEFYEQGKLKEAETFFRFLSIYDFYNTDYVMGLAAVYQLTKRYEKSSGTLLFGFCSGKR